MLLFTATWCKPCGHLKKWLNLKGIEVDVVDIDEEPELAKRNKVRGIPALVVGGRTYTGNENIRPYLEKLNG